MSERCQQIVACARGWLGVPFRHQGRSRHGVDCLGLLACVAGELKLEKAGQRLADFDETDYGHIPDEARLWNGLCRVLHLIDKDVLQPGDVALMRIDGNARHVGIVSSYALPVTGGEPTSLSLIHAYAPARKVVEHRLDDMWQRRIVTGFRF